MKLQKYTMGIGDRFAHQGLAQLSAFAMAKEMGVDVYPVWNKSHREHQIINTTPSSVRAEADAAVMVLGWQDEYYVDADHINLTNVDGFIDHSDFFTLDVADYIGEAPDPSDLEAFVKENSSWVGPLNIPGIDETFDVTEEMIRSVGVKFLFAVKEAGKIYRHILSKKDADAFVTEVSMDESEDPQTPVELFFIRCIHRGD